MFSNLNSLLWLISQEGPVSKVNGYRLDNRGLIPGRGRDSFLHLCIPSLLSTGYRGLSLGLKWQQPKLTTHAEIKNVWHFTSTLLYILMVWCFRTRTTLISASSLRSSFCSAVMAPMWDSFHDFLQYYLVYAIW